MKHEQPAPAEGQFIVLLVHLYRDMVRAYERHVGMSQSRLELLRELCHKDEMSQTALGQHLGIEGAAVTRFVKDMEATGLITRRVDPQDNRFTLVSLAPEGRCVIQEARELKKEFEAQIMEGLSAEERALLINAIQHIQENLHQWQEREERQAQRSASDT